MRSEILKTAALNMSDRRATTSGASPKASSRIGANATGAGTGTLLVLLANNLPDGHPWKSWLVLLAPFVTVATSATYGWIKASIDRRLKRQELAIVVGRAKRTLTEALHNYATSKIHREQLRKELESLELLLVRTDLEKIRVLSKAPRREIKT